MVGVIVAQIRALFGLPSMFVKNAKTSTYGVPAAVTGIADWFVPLNPSKEFYLSVYCNLNCYVVCLVVSLLLIINSPENRLQIFGTNGCISVFFVM